MNKSRHNKKTLFQDSFLGCCFSLFFLLTFFFSCDKGREVRKYKKQESALAETKTKPLSRTGKQPLPDRVSYQWATPEGWSEVRKTSGMRLATFSIKSQNRESLCTIIPLKGAAGGIRANVMRWLGQINVKMEPGSQKVEKFLAGGEKLQLPGNLPAVLFDFTTVTAGAEDNSILATIITLKNSTVFIKMTGVKSHLVANKEKFKALSQSFTLKPGQ